MPRIGGAAVARHHHRRRSTRVCHEETIRLGGYPSPLNYRGFPKSVCTSVNEVICHGIPDDRPLADGDIVNLDVTIFVDGVHGDMQRDLPGGRRRRGLAAAGARRRRECLEHGIAAVSAGAADLRHRPGHRAARRRRRLSGWCTPTAATASADTFHAALQVPHYFDRGPAARWSRA